MSDDSNPQGRPQSWTPPPPGNSTPPPPRPVQHDTAQQGDPTGGSARRTSSGPNVNLSAPLVFGVVAIIGVVLGLFLKESPGGGAPSENLWDRLSELWSIVAIVAAVLSLLPALHNVVSLGAAQAWKIGAGAAALLVFWWVLFVLPLINLNVSFLATIGVAAAVLAVWTSEGNPSKADSPTTS